MKRLFDLTLSILGTIFLLPIFVLFSFLVWFQDKKNPFYFASRVGKHNKIFTMIKIRSMVIDAEKKGGESTSHNDSRITSIGKIIRRYKIDELTQLLNVIRGDMSLVGPRPNTRNGVNVYTQKEKKLLSVRPGITDFSSIVFSDEGEILSNSEDPDHDYDLLIRPWKSRLGIIYIENMSILLDLRIIFITIKSIFSKERALSSIIKELTNLGVNNHLVEVCRRRTKLVPADPPGV